MAECGTYLSAEDIFRLIYRTDGTDVYINIIDSGVDIDDTEPIECLETLTEEDILNLVLDQDINDNWGLNAIIL